MARFGDTIRPMDRWPEPGTVVPCPCGEDAHVCGERPPEGCPAVASCPWGHTIVLEPNEREAELQGAA